MTHRRSQPNNRPIRSARSAVRGAAFETLEKRVLLSGGTGGTFRPGAPPPHVPTSEDIADVKNGPMATAGPKIIDMYREFRRFQKAGGAAVDFDPTNSEYYKIKDGRIGVSVRGRVPIEQLTTRLRQSDAEIIYRSRQNNVIDVYVPFGQLHELARDPMVASMAPMYQAITWRQGTADNQADFVQKTLAVKDNYTLDGSGVRIGVLSDSVNRFNFGLPGSIATGDLPTMPSIQVISDSESPGFASDEGRAMMELIHDIAPGAELAFATADFGMQAFADYIRALRAAGSDIIVDDIGFFLESWYQPSVIDQAITDVVNDGAIYLSSAGNSSAQGGFESLTNWSKIGRYHYVDWDPGPQVDTKMRITLDQGGTFFMQWDEPYNGVVGSAQSDIDVFVYDSVYGRKFHVGVENNIKTGSPTEAFFIPAGEWDIEVVLIDRLEGAPLPTRFRIISFGEAQISQTEYAPLNFSSIAGHNGGEDTISVGAVPWFQPTANEDFSSTGPVTRVFNASGTRLASPVSLQKPDISGIDGVNTSFFGSDIPEDNDVLPNFFGTSAAAPNVAALIALFREAAPSMTQAEVLEALQETALPMNGQPVGWDEQGGFGLVEADAAIQRFLAPPVVHLPAVEPDPRVTPVDSLRIVFDHRVNGFDVSDLTLRRDNGPNLLTGNQPIETTDNGRTWLLRNLTQLTSTPGTYELRLVAAGSGITNIATNQLPLENDAVVTFTVLEFPPVPNTPSDLKTKVVDEGVVRLRWTDNSNNEDRFVIQRAEDANFTTGLKSFNVPANRTVYTDEVILPVGRRLYYRVRAVNNFSEFGGTSNVAEVFLPGPGEIVLDNESSRGVRITGAWQVSNTVPGFNGESYLSDLNSGKGDKEVRFTPNVTRAGDYFVYARWTRADDHATNVPYDIYFANGRKQTVVVDQRNSGGDGWVLLGKFNFALGTGGFVRIHNAGTNGVVTVDAVRFQPANGSG